MYLDFGAGYDLDLLCTRFLKFSKREYIVGIDRRTDNPTKYKKFFAIMDSHYKKVDNMWVKKSEPPFRFYDCYICADIRDEIDILELADTWSCVSTLEHVPEEEVEDFLKGMVAKVKKDSVGHIHIDLTDHRKYPPDPEDAFLHYTDETWGRTRNKDYSGLFLNRIRRDEWFKILDQYFTYELAVNDGWDSVSIYKVKPK